MKCVEINFCHPLPDGVTEDELLAVVRLLFPRASISRVHWMSIGVTNRYYYRIAFKGTLLHSVDNLKALQLNLPLLKFTIHNSDL